MNHDRVSRPCGGRRPGARDAFDGAVPRGVRTRDRHETSLRGRSPSRLGCNACRGARTARDPPRRPGMARPPSGRHRECGSRPGRRRADRNPGRRGRSPRRGGRCRADRCAAPGPHARSGPGTVARAGSGDDLARGRKRLRREARAGCPPRAATRARCWPGLRTCGRAARRAGRRKRRSRCRARARLPAGADPDGVGMAAAGRAPSKGRGIVAGRTPPCRPAPRACAHPAARRRHAARRRTRPRDVLVPSAGVVEPSAPAGRARGRLRRLRAPRRHASRRLRRRPPCRDDPAAGRAAGCRRRPRDGAPGADRGPHPRHPRSRPRPPSCWWRAAGACRRLVLSNCHGGRSRRAGGRPRRRGRARGIARPGERSRGEPRGRHRGGGGAPVGVAGRRRRRRSSDRGSPWRVVPRGRGHPRGTARDRGRRRRPLDRLRGEEGTARTGRRWRRRRWTTAIDRRRGGRGRRGGAASPDRAEAPRPVRRDLDPFHGRFRTADRAIEDGLRAP